MANLTGPKQSFHGDTSKIDTVARHELGARAMDASGNEYVYLAGVTGVTAGSWVVFDENYATTLLVANEVGPVGIAMAAVDASTSYGWFQIYGKNTIAKTDTVAADKALFIDGTAGRADDAGVAGDLIIGAYSMTADATNVATVWLEYPSVSDDLGAAAGGTPGGSDTQVQFNDGGSFGGDAGLTYDKTTDTLTVGILLAVTSAKPSANDGAALGSTALQWSDLFLASGAVINFANGDAVLTHSAGILTVSTGDLRVTTAGTNAASVVTVGGAQTLTSKVLTAATITTSLVPTSDDGAALGSTANKFSDLFLASGAVINFNSGDVTVTHSANTLTFAGASSGYVFDAALSIGTANALTAGTIELGHASDTTLSRASAGVLAVEGVNVLTVAGGTLTGSLTLGENTALALDPAGSADGKYTGITVTATAGYTQAFGDLVYLDPTDSRWELADANSASGADGDSRGILGMVVVAGTDGAACTILLHGIIRADAKFPAMTINAPMYVSETAGAITGTKPTTTDNVIRCVGHAITADELYFNPEPGFITHV